MVNASEGILEEHEEHHEEEHHHEENAHIWVSIEMYKNQVKNIAKDLCRLDPENKEIYQKNESEYLKKLKSLQEEMKMVLKNIKQKDIVTFHEAFSFFAEEFDLHVVAVIEREPGTNPSAGELAKIIDTIKKTNATAIFVEPQYEASTAEVIARETKKPVYTLDPVVSGTLEKDAYEKIMRKNMEVLKEAMQ